MLSWMTKTTKGASTWIGWMMGGKETVPLLPSRNTWKELMYMHCWGRAHGVFVWFQRWRFQDEGSVAQVAKLLGAPVVLVLDASLGCFSSHENSLCQNQLHGKPLPLVSVWWQMLGTKSFTFWKSWMTQPILSIHFHLQTMTKAALDTRKNEKITHHLHPSTFRGCSRTQGLCCRQQTVATYYHLHFSCPSLTTKTVMSKQ